MEKASSVAGSNPTTGEGGLTDLMWTTYDYDPCAYLFNSGTLSPFDNYTQPSGGTSHLFQVRSCLEQIVIPVIFGIGIIGNVANLFLLNSHHLYPHRRQASPTERSAITGLKTLAASDLLFCLVGVLVPIVKRSTVSAGAMAFFSAYYIHHKTAFFNVFLFTSTWLIALISVERYIAVCHPFRAASLIRVRRTICAHVTVFFVSVLLNIPLFLKFSIESRPCRCGHICYFAAQTDYFTSGFKDMHYIVWFTIGTITPLVLILTSNALLTREIFQKSSFSSAAGVQRGGSGMGASRSSGSNRSRSVNVSSSEKTSTLQLTLTLLAVVFCYVIFVCPSMFLHFVNYVDESRTRELTGSVEKTHGSKKTETFHWVLVITNLTQAIKFSSNFLLYCAINKTFRQMFARLVRANSCRTQNSHLQQQQQQQQQLKENGAGMKSPGELIRMNEK